MNTKRYQQNKIRYKPLVSIITATYNGKDYFEETIKSVTNQTYKHIEFIVIDGGSTDGTLKIIKKYEKRINCWLSEPDKGMYDAINKGLLLCKGEIISYINSDDLYFENSTVEKVVDYFSNNRNVLWVYSNVLVINSISEIVNSYKIPKFSYQTYASLKWSPIPQPTTFWKKEAISQCGIFNNNLKMAGDYEFFLRLLKKYKPVKLNFITAKARHHSNSLSSKNQIQNKIEHETITKLHNLNNIPLKLFREKIYILKFKFFNIHNYLRRLILILLK